MTRSSQGISVEQVDIFHQTTQRAEREQQPLGKGSKNVLLQVSRNRFQSGERVHVVQQPSRKLYLKITILFTDYLWEARRSDTFTEESAKKFCLLMQFCWVDTILDKVFFGADFLDSLYEEKEKKSEILPEVNFWFFSISPSSQDESAAICSSFLVRRIRSEAELEHGVTVNSVPAIKRK